jgi:pimeloyl-ACP methyl ester carboxylesterase
MRFYRHDEGKLMGEIFAREFQHEMVFIHGLFGQNGQYQGMIKALEKEGVRLHTPSLRGYSTERLSVRFSASEVLGAARQAVIQVYKDTQKKPWLFGSSLGSIFAVRYAIEHPETIKGLILHAIVDPAILPLTNGIQRAFHRLGGWLFWASPILGLIPFPFPWFAGMYPKKRIFYSLKGLMELFYDQRFREELEQISLPSFLIVGSKDRLLPPDYCLSVFRRLGGVQGDCQLENAGHGVLMTHPYRVGQQIAAWLAEEQQACLT